jgi:hypothetical protein
MVTISATYKIFLYKCVSSFLKLEDTWLTHHGAGVGAKVLAGKAEGQALVNDERDNPLS